MSHVILLFVLLGTLLVLEAAGKHILREVIKHESRPDYIKLRRAHPMEYHEIIIAIKQNNMIKMEEILYDISTMESPNYGKYLSFEEVGALVKNEIATNAVVEWLKSNKVDIVKQTKFGEYITASASVSTWEKLLNAQMNEYILDEHAYSYDKRDRSVLRAESYSIPEEIDDHVFAIHGFTYLPPMLSSGPRVQIVTNNEKSNLRSENQMSDITLTSSSSINPSNLRSIYNIAGTGNGLGIQAIYGNLNQTFLPSDLALFESTFGLPSHGVDCLYGNVPNNNKCNTASGPDDCGEASLDVQYILAVAETVPTYYWYDDSGSSSANFMVAFVTQLANTAVPALVYSISYAAYEVAVQPSSISTFNTEAIKLGLRGVTFVAATGDDGVTGFAFRSSGPLSQCGYYAMWPASSPYVVAVGATMNGVPLTGTAEIACAANTGSAITTGGGFSNSMAAPAFQASAVGNYTAQFTAPQSSFQPYVLTNRAYPDISMPGNSYQVFVGGTQYLFSGTSASAPVFAGMIALVNAFRIENNLATTPGTGLGWMNPSIYANNGKFVLNDITSGNNKCTADENRCCTSVGFVCKPGWDPVTGFGSVDYAKMLSFYTTSVPTFAPTASPISVNVTAFTCDVNSTAGVTSSAPSSDSSATLIEIVVPVVVGVVVIVAGIGIVVSCFGSMYRSKPPVGGNPGGVQMGGTGRH